MGGRRDRPYQGGRSKHWVKIKNGKHQAMERVMGGKHFGGSRLAWLDVRFLPEAT
jgi:ATP-dependent DNA ligase